MQCQVVSAGDSGSLTTIVYLLFFLLFLWLFRGECLLPTILSTAACSFASNKYFLRAKSVQLLAETSGFTPVDQERFFLDIQIAQLLLGGLGIATTPNRQHLEELFIILHKYSSPDSALVIARSSPQLSRLKSVVESFLLLEVPLASSLVNWLKGYGAIYGLTAQSVHSEFLKVGRELKQQNQNQLQLENNEDYANFTSELKTIRDYTSTRDFLNSCKQTLQRLLPALSSSMSSVHDSVSSADPSNTPSSVSMASPAPPDSSSSYAFPPPVPSQSFSSPSSSSFPSSSSSAFSSQSQQFPNSTARSSYSASSRTSSDAFSHHRYNNDTRRSSRRSPSSSPRHNFGRQDSWRHRDYDRHHSRRNSHYRGKR